MDLCKLNKFDGDFFFLRRYIFFFCKFFGENARLWGWLGLSCFQVNRCFERHTYGNAINERWRDSSRCKEQSNGNQNQNQNQSEYDVRMRFECTNKKIEPQSPLFMFAFSKNVSFMVLNGFNHIFSNYWKWCHSLILHTAKPKWKRRRRKIHEICV